MPRYARAEKSEANISREERARIEARLRVLGYVMDDK